MGEASIISRLQDVQDRRGYIPKSSIYTIAREFEVSPAKVMGVATFYSQFRLNRPGKNLIALCDGTACHVNGSAAIAAAVRDELGIGDGETTKDGRFTLKFVACLGCCSLSPVMLVNDVVYGSLTPEKAREILRNVE